MQSKIWEIIENFCVNTESFTSLDVSNAVKQNGFPGARHRDIAPVVRQIFADDTLDSFGYMRTLIDVELLNGLKTKTNLYHNVSVSPDDYANRKQIAIPPKKDDVDDSAQSTTFTFNDNSKDRVLIPPPVAGTIPNNDIDVAIDAVGFEEDEINCYCKADGRLEIPVGWVREMGWTYANISCVLRNNKIAVINGALNDNDTFLADVCISLDNRVRIPKTAFMKAGFDYRSRAQHLIIKCDDCFEIEDSNM